MLIYYFILQQQLDHFYTFNYCKIISLAVSYYLFNNKIMTREFKLQGTSGHGVNYS